MIVSVTERGSYRRCRRRWHLGSANGLNLTNAGTVDKALDLGTLVHKSLADWILDPATSLEGLFKHHSAAKVAELNKHYLDMVGAKPSDDEIEPILEAVILGLEMMKNYQAFHKTPLPAHMGFVAPEQEVQVPIPGTEHVCPDCNGSGKASRTKAVKAAGLSTFVEVDPDPCETCHGTGIVYHYLRGTLDGLVQDRKDRLHVLEHKTYGRRPRRETLDRNDQFLAYIWVLKQLGIGEVAGIAYDGMWKRAKPPKNASMTDLFIRAELSRTDEELDEFQTFLRDEVIEMANPDLPLYINRRWEGCSDCNFERLCTAMSRGEDADYIIKTFYKSRGSEEKKDRELVEAEPY